MQKFITILTLMTFSLLLWPVAVSAQPGSESRTIVFIHGLFQNARSWDKWVDYFSQQGYTCYAPSFPYHEGEPATLQHNIHPNLVNLEFREVLDSMTTFVDKLPEKPIIIGHSIGGLITQKLVEAGKIEMGITLSSANPRGISVLNWKFIRSNFRMVSPFRRRDKVCTPPLRWFKYTFFNTLNDSAAQAEHARYFVPESRKIAKSSTEKGLEIDFDKPHVPMLFISGALDQDLPPSLIRKNFDAYTDPNSKRDYYEFPGKSHYISSETGWEDVASFVKEWIASVQEYQAHKP
ncbi:alpha/beta hydrolase [Catalinimonas sp. 4WD22]|uniref:alpha/beta hydrolase n=1 Tax=Catalinimonas locisalis TaxID=3133978 RepID=UPI003101A6B8